MVNDLFVGRNMYLLGESNFLYCGVLKKQQYLLQIFVTNIITNICYKWSMICLLVGAGIRDCIFEFSKNLIFTRASNGCYCNRAHSDRTHLCFSKSSFLILLVFLVFLVLLVRNPSLLVFFPLLHCSLFA